VRDPTARRRPRAVLRRHQSRRIEAARPEAGFSERDAREQGIFIQEAYSLLDRLVRH
jgi:transposase InsO family protein